MSFLSRRSRGRSRFRPSTHNPLDRFFRNDFMDLWNGPVETVPPVNIHSEKDHYSIDLAAPGLRKEDFVIEALGSELSISCDKPAEAELSEESFSRLEYNYSSFRRSFFLPEDADTERVTAAYNAGLLKLQVPKKRDDAEPNGRKIKTDLGVTHR